MYLGHYITYLGCACALWDVIESRHPEATMDLMLIKYINWFWNYTYRVFGGIGYFLASFVLNLFGSRPRLPPTGRPGACARNQKRQGASVSGRRAAGADATLQERAQSERSCFRSQVETARSVYLCRQTDLCIDLDLTAVV